MEPRRGRKQAQATRRGFLAACACAALSALSADRAAGATDDGWVYVRRRQADPCAGYEGAREKAKKVSDADDAEPERPAGDALVEGTYAHGVASRVYDCLVGTYGLSGAAAAGILSNIMAESGFLEDAGEWNGRAGVLSGDRAVVRFGMDSDRAPEGLCWYYSANGGMTPQYSLGDYADHTGQAGWTPGGGGLFQETPYTVYTDWVKDSAPSSLKEGRRLWDCELQVAFMMQYANRMCSDDVSVPYMIDYFKPGMSGTVGFANHEDWFTTSDPSRSAVAFQYVYLRGAAWALDGSSGIRVDSAESFNRLFNPNDTPADRSKWGAWWEGGDSVSYVSPSVVGPLGAPGECESLKEGSVDTGLWLDVARSYAMDASIGYSMATRFHNPNMDCSSFVYYCLRNCGNEALSSTLGSSPFTTHEWSMQQILPAAGFVRHDFKGTYDGIEPGAIMLSHGYGWDGTYHEHTEFYLGKFDADHNEDERGTPYTIGAHLNSDGVDGDGTQQGSSYWGGEVGAVPAMYGWMWYYTPDRVPGAKGSQAGPGGGQAYADALPWQKRIADAARTLSGRAGMCLKFVNDAYEAAGVSAPRYALAREAWSACCTSSDPSGLEVGMALAVPTNSASATPYVGHIGVYVGDGWVADMVADGAARISALDEWVGFYESHAIDGRSVRWGFLARP